METGVPESPRKPSSAPPTVLVMQPNGYDIACGCVLCATRFGLMLHSGLDAYRVNVWLRAAFVSKC